MIKAYEYSGIKLDRGVKTLIEKVVDDCNVCKEFKRSLARPKVALPKLNDFNQVVTLDLKDIDNEKKQKVHILWMCCGFTRFIKGVVIKKLKTPPNDRTNNKEKIRTKSPPKYIFLIY